MKKMYSCMLAMSMMALAANAADYYLIGGFNEWKESDPKCLFTDKGDGTYELSYEGTVTSGFKINDGTWTNDAANWGSNGDMLVPGEVYNLTVGGTTGNIVTGANLENPTFVFNPAEATLLVKANVVEAEYGYMLWGSFDGSDAWTGVNLTESNNTWVAKNVEVSDCNFGIREYDVSTDAQTRWFSSASDAEVTVGTAMPIKVEGANFSLAAGTYDFTFDLNAMTLLVANAGDEPIVTPEVSYGIHGNIFGSWETKNMTYENGNWVLADVEVLTGEFGIKKMDSTGEQTAWYSAAGEPQVVLNEAMTLMVNGTNLKLNAGTYTFTFDPANTTLTVTGKQGEIVEDVLSYKIHGDIFGDPNWSSKEMIEKDGEWILSANDCVAGNFGIQVVNQFGQPKSWISSAADGTVTLGQSLPAATTDNTNWTLAKGGNYNFTFNPETMTLVVKDNTDTGVEGIEAADAEAVYFNLQGVRVAEPTEGVFVKVAGGKATKIVIKK